MAETKTAENIRIKVAEELEKQWLDLTKIKGWLKGHKGIPEKAQEQLAHQIRALYAEFGLRPDLGHVIVMGDRPYVTKEGLIYYAQRTKKLAGIEVEIVERKQNFCLVKARVLTKDGGRYEAYGDADANNTNRMVTPHLIRMAETRAVNRALRVAFPIGLCSFEELAEQDVIDPVTGEEVKVEVEKEATQRQLNTVNLIAEKRGLTGELLKEFIEIHIGKSSLEELNREEVSTLISTLNDLAPKGMLIEIQKQLKDLGIKNGERRKLYEETVGKSSSKIFTREEARAFLDYLEQLKAEREKKGKEEENGNDIEF